MTRANPRVAPRLLTKAEAAEVWNHLMNLADEMLLNDDEIAAEVCSRAAEAVADLNREREQLREDAMAFAERLQGMKIEAQEWAEAAAMAAKGSMAILKENEALRNTLREIKSLPASYGLQHAKNLAKAALGKEGSDEA